MTKKPRFDLAHQVVLREGMKLLVTSVPPLSTFNGNMFSREAWAKVFLGHLVMITDMQYYATGTPAAGLVGIQLVNAKIKTTNYVHESCLMDFGIRS